MAVTPTLVQGSESVVDPHRNVFATVFSSDNYALPAKVFAHSLRATRTRHRIIAFITPEVSRDVANSLVSPQLFDEVIQIQSLANPSPPQGMLRPYFAHTYTKLRLWQQTQFDTIAYFDPDVVVLKSVDDLFTMYQSQ